MLLSNCVYVALKGGKLHLDLWTAVTRAERPDVPVDPADSSRILWFHSDWQGTVCRVAQEKPVIMTGWSEPRRRRWKKKPKKKEGEGRRRKKGVGALYHTHTCMHATAHRLISKATCVHTLTDFFFFFFLWRTSASCIISVGGRGERIERKQTNENASLHHSPSVSSIFLLFGVKIRVKTAQRQRTCSRRSVFLCYLMLTAVTLSRTPVKTAPPSSTYLWPLQTWFSPRARLRLPQSCVWVHLSTIPSSEAMRGGVEPQITPSCQFWRAERESGLAMLQVGWIISTSLHQSLIFRYIAYMAWCECTSEAKLKSFAVFWDFVDCYVTRRTYLSKDLLLSLCWLHTRYKNVHGCSRWARGVWVNKLSSTDVPSNRGFGTLLKGTTTVLWKYLDPKAFRS